MKTYSTRPSHVESRWHVVDAGGRILGRLATELSVLLQGKHKPMYARHIITGDFVIVVNASRIMVTGKKLQQKLYRRHSDYPGGLRETTLAKLQENHPDRVLRSAVRGMLPKNTLGRQMLRRLKVYAGESHPHEAQVRGSAKLDVQALPPEPGSAVPAEVQEPEQPLEAQVKVTAPDEAEESPPEDLQLDTAASKEPQSIAQELPAEMESPAQAEEQSLEVPAEESTEDKAES